jgi:hypothetical protein
MQTHAKPLGVIVALSLPIHFIAYSAMHYFVDTTMMVGNSLFFILLCYILSIPIGIVAFKLLRRNETEIAKDAGNRLVVNIQYWVKHHALFFAFLLGFAIAWKRYFGIELLSFLGQFIQPLIAMTSEGRLVITASTSLWLGGILALFQQTNWLFYTFSYLVYSWVSGVKHS